MEWSALRYLYSGTCRARCLLMVYVSGVVIIAVSWITKCVAPGGSSMFRR